LNITAALQIDGYMEEAELSYLAALAGRRRRIVEVGSYKGRSLRAMADGSSAVLYAVDTWEQLGGRDDFNVNLASYLGERVFPVTMSSLCAAKMFHTLGAKFDMIFIDADHSYEAVRDDILHWSPLLAEGGILCGHDYQDPFPGVKKAVDELVPQFRVIGRTIWTTEVEL